MSESITDDELKEWQDLIAARNAKLLLERQEGTDAESAEDLTYRADRFDAVLDDTFDRAPVEPEWLLEPIVPKALADGRGTNAMVFGASGAGKSYALLSLLAPAALAEPVNAWTGEALDKPVKTLWLNYDGTPLGVYLDMLGIDLGALQAGGNFLHVSEFDDAHVQTLSVKRQANALVETCVKRGIEVVVIDTLLKSLAPDCDENQNKEFTKLDRFCISQLQAAGISVIQVDHSTKKSLTMTPRGSGTKITQCDVVWFLSRGKADGKTKLINTKKRLPYVPDKVQLTRAKDGSDHYFKCSVVDQSADQGEADEASVKLQAAGLVAEDTVNSAIEKLKATHGKGMKRETVATYLRDLKAASEVPNDSAENVAYLPETVETGAVSAESVQETAPIAPKPAQTTVHSDPVPQRQSVKQMCIQAGVSADDTYETACVKLENNGVMNLPVQRVIDAFIAWIGTQPVAA